MSTIIIITPPPTKPQAQDAGTEEINGMTTADYDAAYAAIDEAALAGDRVRIITD